jgi:hypothetical protein
MLSHNGVGSQLLHGPNIRVSGGPSCSWSLHVTFPRVVFQDARAKKSERLNFVKEMRPAIGLQTRMLKTRSSTT